MQEQRIRGGRPSAGYNTSAGCKNKCRIRVKDDFRSDHGGTYVLKDKPETVLNNVHPNRFVRPGNNLIIGFTSRHEYDQEKDESFFHESQILVQSFSKVINPTN